MAVEVRIPTILRKYTDGEKKVRAAGATIKDVLADLDANHPGIAGQLYNPDGSLHRFVNVYLNGRDVRYLGGLDTPVDARDEIRLLPAIAGG